jgi:hypothetical protein
MMQIRSRFAAAIVGLMYLNTGSFASAGTLLPNGEQQFWGADGTTPNAAGCVYFYFPGTTTPKTTYQNSAQTIANTNPVQLDAAGRAIIYGTGTYRQVVDATGPNGTSPCLPPGQQIWDQITADTSSSITIYAGASSGTPNAVTVNAPAFSGADGQVINFISTNTNTGGATLNPSGFGAVGIVRDSSTGPNALAGGELVATNAVSLIYDATAGTFHILSPVTWPNTSGVPVGATIAVSGFLAPTNYAFAYGQAVSRTTFSSLLAAYTSAQTGSLSSGSPTISGLTDTTQFAAGQTVEAIGIPSATTILACDATTCTLSANATATRSGTITFFAYGDGDGSTTFNLPNYSGRSLTGRDNMGGTASNVSQIAANLSTTSTSTSATVSSATGLSLGMSINGNVNVPSGTTITSISGTTLTLSQAATATQSTVATRFSPFPDAQGLGITGGLLTGTLVTQNLPAYTPSGTNSAPLINSGTITGVPTGTGQQVIQSGTGSTTFAPGSFVTITSSAPIFTGSAQGGRSIPISEIPPSTLVNWAVKLTP